MEFRHLGSSGLEIFALPFGVWVTMEGHIDDETSYYARKYMMLGVIF